MRSFIVLLMFMVLTSYTWAAKTGLPIPRFVSLRSAEVNIRVGPGPQFPLRWQSLRREPVEITAEFSNWRKIRYEDGAEGWVHQSMLSGKRLVKLIKPTILRQRAFDDAAPLARIEENVIAELRSCKGKWCKVHAKDASSSEEFQGWIPRETIWGVYDHEEKF